MFNWFRRKLNKPEESPTVAPLTKIEAETGAETGAVEAPVESVTATEQEKQLDGASQADYLNWAKSAYKNIQARKEQAAAAPAEPDTTSAENIAVADVDPGVEEIASPIAAIEPEPAPEPAIASPETDLDPEPVVSEAVILEPVETQL